MNCSLSHSLCPGYSTGSSSFVELNCAYAERSQVASVKWMHIQRPGFQLPLSGVLGRTIISVDLPITTDTAGQYACTLKLKNGQTVRYVYTAMMPSTGKRPHLNSKPQDPHKTTGSFKLTLLML